ncbi:DUF3793 family protein [Clostridium fallax]|uniref:DUF3793 domain-containing protein n=1 Tax=Clostridium fallax TaxID=1533 RepID=A0A1M4STA8_9CLOT|nr:DUF3793 family protein [Clostridium fallax]SHE35426.1 Protein of unknown function [Clostridium fallax]SQB07960.1 Protein of uncharacterised function (DUF3793) [Clostridium fallax]
MNKEALDFFYKIENMNKKNYMEHFITYLIAPVLSGIKPSSTITFTNNNNNLLDSWNSYGENFIKKLGLKYEILKELSNGLIILIYNEEILEKHLLADKNKEFLCNLGYGNKLTLKHCLSCLKNKFEHISFPHESGIFLGIPLEDVIAFMEKEKEILFCGYWKVYSNYERARSIFELYDKSKELVAKAVLEDKSISLIINEIKNIYKHYNYVSEKIS